MYKKYIKRFLDITISLVGIIVLLIPMLLISMAIKLDSRGPVIFNQIRLGKDMKCFKIYKFRSMILNAYEIGGTNTYHGDPRITKVGSFLRRTSLDETLQLFNILKGDMSIIGPRPILPIEFEEYKVNSLYQTRYSVLPGLFCTVDLDYRAQATRELQFEMDAQYSKNITFMTDVKLFLCIILNVLKGSNVYKENEVSK